MHARPHGGNHWYSQGNFGVSGGSVHPKMRKIHEFQCFYGTSAKSPMIPACFIKILEMCDFPHACVRPPRNINIPLGISMVSSMSWSHRIMEIAKDMKFHENHGFSCNLLKFHEIPWNSHFLCYMGASTPPWLKTLIFLRDYWWFRRHHRLENTESHVISAISRLF